MSDIRIGVIGGSGLYEMEGMTVREERRIETPFGDPRTPTSSASWTAGRWSSCRATAAATACCPPSSTTAPTSTASSCSASSSIISVSRRRLAEDRVQARPTSSSPTSSSTAPGTAPTPSSATAWSPTSRSPSRSARGCSTSRPTPARAAGATVHQRRHLRLHGGAAVLDPRRVRASTAAGASDIIGMTNLQEAKLAREAEICYVSLSHGHRLRLLARDGRGGLRRLGDGGHRPERQDVAGGGARRC